MNYLILLNRKFPYKTGEAFLENEINEIAKHFDKILIYPSDIKIGEKQTRLIKSTNVEPRLVERLGFCVRKKIYLLKSVKYIGKCLRIRGFRNKIAEAYFLAAAHSQSRKIMKDLEKIGIKRDDKVFLYSYWLYINAKAACMIGETLKAKGYVVKIVSRAHRFDIYEDEEKNKYIPHRQGLLKGLDEIFPCSDDGANYLGKKYKKYKAKIRTSYLGTYDHGMRKASKHNSFNILSCSRISSQKRIDLIIDSLALLRDSGLNITWTHIGGGELFDHMKQSAGKKLGWMKYNFLGPKTNKEVYDYYLNNDIDLFLNTSSSEGLPVSIMEAISFGVPVIATDVGGNKEIVITGINGYIIPKSFTNKYLAAKIEEFARMGNGEYVLLRQNARQHWEKHFEAKKNYGQFAQHLLGDA